MFHTNLDLLLLSYLSSFHSILQLFVSFISLKTLFIDIDIYDAYVLTATTKSLLDNSY